MLSLSKQVIHCVYFLALFFVAHAHSQVPQGEIEKVPADMIKYGLPGSSNAVKQLLSNPAYEDMAGEYASKNCPNCWKEFTKQPVRYASELERFRVAAQAGTMSCDEYESYRDRIGGVIDRMEHIAESLLGLEVIHPNKDGKVRVREELNSLYIQSRKDSAAATARQGFAVLESAGKVKNGKVVEGALKGKTVEDYQREISGSIALPCEPIEDDLDELFSDIDIDAMEAENDEREQDLRNSNVTMDDLVARERAVRNGRQSDRVAESQRRDARRAAESHQSQEQNAWGQLFSEVAKAAVMSEANKITKSSSGKGKRAKQRADTTDPCLNSSLKNAEEKMYRSVYKAYCEQ